MILLKRTEKLSITLLCHNDILLSLISTNNLHDSHFFSCKSYTRRLVKKNVC